jgi:hypothetical protein
MSHHLKNINTTSIKAIAARVLAYLPKHSVSIDQIEEWAYEAYASIAPREVYEVHISQLNVTNNKASLPLDLFKLEMVLFQEFDSVGFTRTNTFTNQDATITTSTDLSSGNTTDSIRQSTLITTQTSTQNVKLNSGSDNGLFKSNNGNITKDQLYYDNPKSRNTNWRPLPLATNIYHNAVLLNKDLPIYQNCTHAFSVQNGCIVTTFTEGVLLVAYTGLPKNEEGEYVIVDIEAVSMALENMVLRNYWKKQWMMGSAETGAHNKYKHFLQMSEVLAPKATAKLMMPDLIEYQNLRNINKFIKEDSPFATIMGALNNNEWAAFGNPPRMRNAYANITGNY